jgi:hypothetical protein
LRRVQLAGRPLEDDVSAGAWIAEALNGRRPGTVAAFVPARFAAFGRVLHPAVRYAGDDDVEVPWAEVAAANAAAAHPLMQWPAITGGWEFVAEEDQSPLWDDSPAEGHLPSTVAARLAAVLRRHTTTPDDCWFGVWQGWGGAPVPATVLRLPGGREQLLVRGPVELAAANMAAEPAEQSANLWWPADRAWCVATDVDLMSTYVGGSAACLAELAGTEGLEVVPAQPGDSVTYAADRLNPVPERA